MMTIIADSGSTKTDWIMMSQLDGGTSSILTTSGINPYFQTEEEITRVLTEEFLPELCEVVTTTAVHFYGAGCAFDKVDLMRRILQHHLPNATVEVGSDMLGAARGLCGHQPGIACILGTGSNSCHFDGEEIVSNVSPLGFILGDEGSGGSMGKLLVGDLLKNQLAPGLKEKFLQQYRLTPADIIERVYRKPFPNRFLASLSPFLAENLHEPDIHRLVLSSFESFIRRNVMQYDYRNTPVHFTGSIAYYYKEVLKEAAARTGIRLGTIARSPIEGLARYHWKG